MMKVTVKRRKKGKGIAGIASLLPGPNKVKVGFPSGEADSDIVQRALWQEFGTRGGASGGGFGGPIPERPFMRNALRSGRSSNRQLMKAEAKEIIQAAGRGESAAKAKDRALKRLGIKVQGDIQDEITSLSSPPNSPLTVALKGSSNPLIDTGEMRGAVSYKVEK